VTTLGILLINEYAADFLFEYFFARNITFRCKI